MNKEVYRLGYNSYWLVLRWFDYLGQGISYRLHYFLRQDTMFLLDAILPFAFSTQL